MDSFLVHIIGYAAAVTGTSLMLPQVYKSWRTKQVGDLSLLMLLLYTLNCVLWLTYGVLIDALPVIITNAIALVIAFIQLFFKFHYS